jgi:hypothetical protein
VGAPTSAPLRPATVLELRDLVGRELGPTAWHDVTQERIDRFAEITDDHQWIHVDRQRASEGPGGPECARGECVGASSARRAAICSSRGVETPGVQAPKARARSAPSWVCSSALPATIRGDDEPELAAGGESEIGERDLMHSPVAAHASEQTGARVGTAVGRHDFDVGPHDRRALTAADRFLGADVESQ